METEKWANVDVTTRHNPAGKGRASVSLSGWTESERERMKSDCSSNTLTVLRHYIFSFLSFSLSEGHFACEKAYDAAWCDFD